MGRPSRSSLKATERKTALAKIRSHGLLQRCDESNNPQLIGTLVWAKDPGSGYWPACIAPHPTPDEDETVEAQEEEDMSKFAFLMYIEPRFRLGLVNWSNIIPVNIPEADMQFGLITDLNKLERKNSVKYPHLNALKEAWLLMEQFFQVEPLERQAKMQVKWKELSEEKKRKNTEATVVKSKLPKVQEQAGPTVQEIKKNPPARRSTKFSLRPNVVASKRWDYAAVTAEPFKDPCESSETSSTSTCSTNKRNKHTRPKNLDGEALKLWTADKFAEMDKQIKFDSKNIVTCSSCQEKISDVNDSSSCHDYPFHKQCLLKIHVKSADSVQLKYKCIDCFKNRCFICKKDNELDDDLPPKCSKCDLRFHRDCLVFKWPQSDVLGSNGVITCPLHFCHVCKAEHFHFDKVRNYKVANAKAIKCVYCLATYHRGTCIPAGTGNSIMLNQWLICPRHLAKESLVPKKKKLGCFTCQKRVTSKDSTVSCTLCPLTFHAPCVHGEYHLKAGISLEQFRESFKCEGCLWGTFPLYGQVVWYQQPGSIYWPSMILYPKDAATRGAKGVGQFSVSYCGSKQYYDNGRSSYSVPLEIGNKDFLKKLNLYSNDKVATAAKESFHLIKLSEGYRDNVLPMPEPIYKKIEKNLYRVPIPVVNIKNTNGRRNSGKKSSTDDDEICQCGSSKGTEPVCTSESGCFNRDAAIECNDVNCSGKELCQNRMFSSKKTAQNEKLLEYFVSPSTKGWGLRTTLRFTKGSFLSEYVGEIISKEEVVWRVERKCDDDPLYFLEVNTTTFIDAEYYGNMSRLINHSCDPNCRIEKYYSAHGKPVVGIFAKRDIEVGEELTFDYNYGPKSTFAFKCRCKSENCKGIVGQTRENEENLVPNGKKIVKGENSDWKWEDECSTCGTRGELLMCDYFGCPKAYHLQCLGIVSTPKGEWNCPQHDPGFEERRIDSGPSIDAPPIKKAKLTTRS